MLQIALNFSTEELEQIGKQIADELLLKKDKDKRYKTLGGTKTDLGLARTICRILEEYKRAWQSFENLL